jgi:hypothetical protein
MLGFELHFSENRYYFKKAPRKWQVSTIPGQSSLRGGKALRMNLEALPMSWFDLWSVLLKKPETQH